MDLVRSRKVLTTAVLCMVLATLSVIGVAVYLRAKSQTDGQPADEAQRFKEAIDSKIADVLKTARTSVKDSSEITDVSDLQILKLLKPMAFLHGLLPNRLSDIQSGRTEVQNWVTTDGLKKSEILNGMEYARGSITVPESGCYRVIVHAMMYYEGPRGHCKNISLDVIRYSAVTQKEDVIHREKGMTCRETNEEASHHPSHFDGLVELNYGDQVYVVVSDLSLLKTYRDDHYFQVYLM